MRRVIVFLTSLVLALSLSAGTANAAPQPATLKAKAQSSVGAPGSLVPVTGTLLHANRRPLTGAQVVVTIEGRPTGEGVQSLTGSGGAFEVYVPLPDDLPSSGVVELKLSFSGTAEAAASTLRLPVQLQPADAVTAGLQQPAVAPAPAVTTPAEHPTVATLPSSGSPFIDQLILVAGGLLGVMILLFGVGAVLRRRRRS
ncbi:MAG: hypothetical protein IPL41_12340 [Micropruina sp.]|nr:hypothetical protein [Micropruina sp.]